MHLLLKSKRQSSLYRIMCSALVKSSGGSKLSNEVQRVLHVKYAINVQISNVMQLPEGSVIVLPATYRTFKCVQRDDI